MTQKAMLVLLLGVIVLVLDSCAKPVSKQPLVEVSAPKSEAPKPSGVTRESLRFPADEYLTGVGSGLSKEAAEKAAFAAVARIFNVEIKATTSSLKQSETLTTDGRVQESYDVKFASSISVETNKVLENVKIVDRWYDERQQINMALAVIDRAHSARLLRSRITELDRDIQVLRQRAESSTDRIETLRALRKALKLLQSREIYNIDLRILSVDASSVDSLVSLADLEQNIQNYLSNEFRIGVTVSGNHHEQIRTSLLEALTKEGFSVEKNTQATELDLLVKTKIFFENVDSPKYKFVRWRISLDLINVKTTNTMGGFEREGKEAHKTFSEANKRAVHAAQKDIVSKIGPELMSFIFLENN